MKGDDLSIIPILFSALPALVIVLAILIGFFLALWDLIKIVIVSVLLWFA